MSAAQAIAELVNPDDPEGSIDRLHDRAEYLAETAARHYGTRDQRPTADRLRREAQQLVKRAAQIRLQAKFDR